MTSLHILLCVLFISALVTECAEAWGGKLVKKYKYHKKRHGKRKDKYNSAKETPHHTAYGTLKNYKQPSRKKEKLEDYDD